MTSKPFASPSVDVQSAGLRPHRPSSAAGIFTAVEAGTAGAALLVGGAPSGLAVSSLAEGRPVTLLASFATGSRPPHATTVTITAQAMIGANVRSMAP